MRTDSKMERLRYRGPDFDTSGVRVSRFEIPPDDEMDFATFMSHLEQELVGRGATPGIYARLEVDDILWMTDTPAERTDHLMAVAMADMRPGGRGLVNGLGLGCVVAAMLDSLEHVDVVEKDRRIADTVGEWMIGEYGERVDVWIDDAFDIKWPPGTKWDVVWHDIWPMLSPANLPEMTRLHRRYAKRADWQGSWGQDFCRWMRDEESRLYELAVAHGYTGPRP